MIFNVISITEYPDLSDDIMLTDVTGKDYLSNNLIYNFDILVSY